MPEKPQLRNYLRQLPIQVGLVIMWLFLWGDFSLLTIVGGIVLSYAVTRIFYLPPVELTGRLNLWYSFIFAVVFIFDVFKASFSVAWVAIFGGKNITSALLKIRLRTRSDLILTITAEVYSLVPGSIVVDVDRNNSVVYLHVIDLKNKQEIEAFRRFALAQEARIIRAIGPKEDLERLRKAEQKEAEKRAAKKAAGQSAAEAYANPKEKQAEKQAEKVPVNPAAKQTAKPAAKKAPAKKTAAKKPAKESPASLNSEDTP